MADVFISYSKKHARLTEDLARDLEAEGYTTWWDTSLLPDDVFFPQIIRAEIEAAKAVIVIWAEHSVASAWVYSEAQLGWALDKLLQVRDEGLDAHRVPLPFTAGNIPPVADRAKIFAALARKEIKPSKRLGTHGVKTEPLAPLAAKAVTEGDVQTKQEALRDAGDKRAPLEVKPMYRSIVIQCPRCLSYYNAKITPGHFVHCENCYEVWQAYPVDNLPQMETITTRTLDCQRRDCVTIFKTSERLVCAVTLSQDGKFLAVGNQEGDLALFDVNLNKNIWRTSLHDSAISAVSISHNNKFIVSGDTNGRLVLWHVSNGKQYQEFDGHFDAAIKTVCFDNSDHVIASATGRTVRFWRFPGEETIKALDPFGFTNALTAISFAPKENLFVACSDDGALKLYETKTWRHIDLIKTGLRETLSTHIRFSQDSKTLLVAAGDCDGITPSNVVVEHFDIASKKRLFTASVQDVGEFWLVERSSSLLCTQKRKLRLLSLPSLHEEWSTETEEGASFAVRATNDGFTIASAEHRQDLGLDHLMVWRQP
jgi:hypothetical protein